MLPIPLVYGDVVRDNQSSPMEGFSKIVNCYGLWLVSRRLQLGCSISFMVTSLIRITKNFIKKLQHIYLFEIGCLILLTEVEYINNTFKGNVAEKFAFSYILYAWNNKFWTFFLYVNEIIYDTTRWRNINSIFISFRKSLRYFVFKGYANILILQENASQFF